MNFHDTVDEAIKTIKPDTSPLLFAMREAAGQTSASNQSKKLLEDLSRGLPSLEPVSCEETLEKFQAALLEPINRQAEELKRQADAQELLISELKQESKDRTKDDKKYFWLGALISLVTAILIEHGSELLEVLQRVFR